MNAHKIVMRAQTGKLLTSPEQELRLEKAVAHHLGVLQRGFASGVFREENIENADETHFVFNMDNGKTLGFRGDMSVKYADVVSGGDPITMMVPLSGGPGAMIKPPMLVFKNINRSYPISGVMDNISGVCYRSGPKGWTDRTVFKAWLEEPRAIRALPDGEERVLILDNASGHDLNEESRHVLREMKTTIMRFPPNATHLVQPVDTFVIQKIKDAWRHRWEQYKLSCIRDNLWTEGSERIPNPGKRFFLKLAAAAVRDFNGQRDANGLRYARKAMIRTGMSLNVNGNWEENQLSDELQRIVATHRSFFEGQVIDE